MIRRVKGEHHHAQREIAHIVMGMMRTTSLREYCCNKVCSWNDVSNFFVTMLPKEFFLLRLCHRIVSYITNLALFLESAA